MASVVAALVAVAGALVGADFWTAGVVAAAFGAVLYANGRLLAAYLARGGVFNDGSGQ